MAIEILSISVNQELVKHSLLTRKIIKVDKDIETIQSEYAPKATKVKNFFRICRVSFSTFGLNTTKDFCALVLTKIMTAFCMQFADNSFPESVFNYTVILFTT